MTREINAEIADLARQVRDLAARIPFDDRANIIRTVAYEVRQAVKFDPTTGGAPQGREWELEGLGLVCDAAENYFYEAAREKRSWPAFPGYSLDVACAEHGLGRREVQRRLGRAALLLHSSDALGHTVHLPHDGDPSGAAVGAGAGAGAAHHEPYLVDGIEHAP